MELNRQKGVEALLYIIESLGGQPTRHQIAKACYWADREHLSKYGRFIYDESYRAMNYGPVPSFVYDVIKGKDYQGVVVSQDPQKVKATRKADKRYFSKSDIKCLEYGVEKVRGKSFRELSNESHDEVYCSVEKNEMISFNKFVEHSEDPKSLLEYLESHKL